jgi:ATP-binding cassette, subfamily B, bacterial PglK
MSPKDKLTYYFLVVIRALSGVLDVIGIALIGLIAGLAATNLDPAKPLVIAGITLPTFSEQGLVWLVIIVLLVFLIKTIIAVALSRILTRFLARVESEQATRIAASVFSKDLGKLQTVNRSEIVWASLGSAFQAFSCLLVSFGTFISEGLLLILISLTFVVVDPIASVFVVVYFGLLVIVIQLFIGSSLKRAGEDTTEGNIESVQAIDDLLGAFREISIAEKTSFYIKKFSVSRAKMARGGGQMTFLSGMPRYVVETALMLGVVIFVGFQFMTGQLATGLVTVGVFLTGGVRIMASLLPLQNAAANVKNQAEQGKLSLDLLAEINSVEEKSPSSISAADEFTVTDEKQDKARGEAVTISDVTFAYPGSATPALKNINMQVDSGQHVAIIGPSGAGKTTLVDLMLGLVTPQEGEVLLGGLPPSERISLFPGTVAYVPQNPGIISGSIAQNVAIGLNDSDIDEARVIDCLKKANLGDLIESLPEGIHTSVGNQTDSLSGGQIQRLGFARAIYSQPKFIVLDEATSALDASSEAFLASSIKALGKSVTVVVIAHRLSTVQHSDVVYVIEGGELIASGKFAQLRKTVPMVAEYVRLMSFEDQLPD